MKQTPSLPGRRYELDWLRVLAFGLLIPFHTGMFFVSWDWHIKNNQVWESLEYPMIFVSQWRMSLLFFISGASLVFALGRRSPRRFLAERARRLLLPLLFGMLVIVPPQTYLQFREKAGLTSFWQVYPFMWADGGAEFNWNHLWYLVYLFVYSALLLPLFSRKQSRLVGVLSHPVVLCGLGLLSGLSEFWLRPLFRSTHDLTDDWANHALYLPIFVMGFAVYTHPRARWFVERHRWYFLVVGLGTVSVLYSCYWIAWPSPSGGPLLFYQLLKGVNRWLWILTILGFAIHRLNRTSAFLDYANEAVFPFYILHQTVIIVLAYRLTQLSWHPAWKFLLLVPATYLICWLLYGGIIRRVGWLRPLFGLKPFRPEPTPEVQPNPTIR